MAEKENLIQIGKVIERLDCSKSLVYDLIKAGKLRATRAGAHLRVYESSLNAYLKENEIDPQEIYR